MVVGIFGGTFNPIHFGHLIIAEEVRMRLRLEEIIFIPSLIPPHKPDAELLSNKDRLSCSFEGKILSAEHRYTMINLALKDNPCFKVSSLELERPGRSYTINTLRQLSKECPQDKFVFIIGSDCLSELDAWKDIDALFKLTQFAVVPRPGCKINPSPLKESSTCPLLQGERIKVRGNKKDVQIVNIPMIDISSSDIRKRCKEGRSIRYLVPEAVRGYIVAQELYQ